MQKWQHIGCSEPHGTAQDFLNKMGSYGWELVAVIPRTEEMDCYYFKRPVESKAPPPSEDSGLGR